MNSMSSDQIPLRVSPKKGPSFLRSALFALPVALIVYTLDIAFLIASDDGIVSEGDSPRLFEFYFILWIIHILLGIYAARSFYDVVTGIPFSPRRGDIGLLLSTTFITLISFGPLINLPVIYLAGRKLAQEFTLINDREPPPPPP